MRLAAASTQVRSTLAAALAALALLAAPIPAPADEVRLHLALSRLPHGTKAEREALRELQYEIAGRLEAAGAGEVVRDEWPEGWCIVHVATADAERAWQLARDAVRAYGPQKGSYAILRRGGSGAPEEKVPL